MVGTAGNWLVDIVLFIIGFEVVFIQKINFAKKLTSLSFPLFNKNTFKIFFEEWFQASFHQVTSFFL